jgi:hypothetical protein
MTDPQTAAKFEMLKRLLELSRAGREALEQDSLTHFQRMLDERDRLIAELEALVETEAAGDGRPANVVAFPGAVTGSEEDTIALDVVLRGILEHDRANEELLRARMDELQGELPALAQGRRAMAGYRVDHRPSTFVDRRS